MPQPIRRKSMFQMMEEMLAQNLEMKQTLINQQKTIAELDNKFEQLIVARVPDGIEIPPIVLETYTPLQPEI